MKNILVALCLTLMFMNCKSDDDSHDNSGTLQGEWSLVNVSGGLAGVDDNFDTGVIVWSFNQETLTLTVTNNNTEIVVYDGLPTGTYEYKVLTTDGVTSSLVIDDYDFSMIIDTLTHTTLLLDDGIVVDGFGVTFKR